MILSVNIMAHSPSHPARWATRQSGSTLFHTASVVNKIAVFQTSWNSFADGMTQKSWKNGSRIMKDDLMANALYILNLCRGLTRAIYILCIERLRMLRLNREPNPGPPALQASTLWKEPFKWPYLVAIRNLSYAATLHPQVADGVSWLNVIRSCVE